MSEVGFISKGDFATNYSYDQQNKPHAVRSVSRIGDGKTVTYEYDLNGNLERSIADQIEERITEYNEINKPTLVYSAATGKISRFFYGPDQARYKQEICTTNQDHTDCLPGSVEKTTYYIGKLHELIEENGVATTKDYVGDYLVITNNTGDRKVNYLHKDRLGSVDTVTNADWDAGQSGVLQGMSIEHGIVADRHGYDPFGKPRQSNWREDPYGGLLDSGMYATEAVTTRGFTQHEHLDEHQLIHMNGRAFDYNLGRFLSVDPLVQSDESQGLNPYSYVLNNPLMGTDPTGYDGVNLDQQGGTEDDRKDQATEAVAENQAPPGVVLKLKPLTKAVLAPSAVVTGSMIPKSGKALEAALQDVGQTLVSYNLQNDNGKTDKTTVGDPKTPDKVNEPSAVSSAEQERIDYASLEKVSDRSIRAVGCKRVFEVSKRRWVQDDKALALLREANEAAVKLGDLSYAEYLSLQNIAPTDFTSIANDVGSGIGEKALDETLKRAGMQSSANMLGKASAVVATLKIANDFHQMAGGDEWGRLSRYQRREKILNQVIGKLTAGNGNMASRVFKARDRLDSWSSIIHPLVLRRINEVKAYCPGPQIK